MKKSRFTDSQIMDTLKRAEAGMAAPDLCRELGISKTTFYKWRSKVGAMDTSMMSRTKELEEQNRRLRPMHVEEKFNTGQEIKASLPLKHQLSRQVLVAPWVLGRKATGYRQRYRHRDEVQHWRGFPGDRRGMHLSGSIEDYRV